MEGASVCTQGPHPLAPTTRRLSPRHPVSLPRDHCPHRLASPSPGEHRLCRRERRGVVSAPSPKHATEASGSRLAEGRPGPRPGPGASLRRPPSRGRPPAPPGAGPVEVGTARPGGAGSLQAPGGSAAGRAPSGGSHSAGPLRAAVTPPSGCGTRLPSQRTAPPPHASRAYCDTHLCLSHAGNRTPGDGRVALTKATSEAVSPRHRRGFDMAAAYSLLRGLWLSPSS